MLKQTNKQTKRNFCELNLKFVWKVARTISLGILLLLQVSQVSAQQPKSQKSPGTNLPANWKCEIPKIQTQIDKIIARYQFAQKMEKNAVEFLGLKNAEDLREQSKLNMNNEYAAMIDTLGKLAAGTFLLASGTGFLPAASASSAKLAAVFFAPPVLSFPLSYDLRSTVGRERGSMNQAESKLLIIDADRNSERFRAVKEQLAAIAEKDRPGIASLDQVLGLQEKSLKNFDRVHQDIHQFLKTREEQFNWFYQSGEFNQKLAEEKKHATAANLKLYTAERKITAEIRQNLNQLCAKMMESTAGAGGGGASGSQSSGADQADRSHVQPAPARVN